MSKTYYVVVHGRGNRWEGLCLDLDIAVHGQSLREVESHMRDAIRSYVASAMKEAPADRDRLLSRRAPFHVRAYYRFMVRLMVALSKVRVKRDTDMVGYPESCPA